MKHYLTDTYALNGSAVAELRKYHDETKSLIRRSRISMICPRGKLLSGRGHGLRNRHDSDGNPELTEAAATAPDAGSRWARMPEWITA